jgi:leucyl-tRNA synthetase
MHKKFNHQEIEKKWQEEWKHSGIYNVGERDATKEKKYVLVEWPYPSGNLHIGHWFAFAVVDIYVRALRMQGKQVLFPIGFDAFGLPAENAAIKRNLDPKEWTESNVAYMKKQLESMGNAFSWDKTTSSTDPEYYTWTQWMFTQFYEKGIAYRGTGIVNWCPGCNTVIANEQVLSDGTCERSGDIIEKKEMPQWMLRITQYADRLIDDLEALHWPEHIKESQRQWIGRSKGAEINFELNLPQFQGDIVFATNNKGKVERMRKLAKQANLTITIKTPEEVGIKDFSVVEDQPTIKGNAEKKARELSMLTDLPVFADDSGFFIDNEELNPVTVKRNALHGQKEEDFSIEEIGTMMAQYYQNIATKHGGSVNAEWRNALTFAVKGTVKHTEAIRPVILTDQIHGSFDPHLPIRCLYKPVVTNKYVADQTDEETMLELKPLADAFKKLLTPSIPVFTTRPDTLFGATYLVLAPEHPWVTLALDETHDVLLNKSEVQDYVKKAREKSDIERTNATKEKTGVELKGVTAINPVNGEEIPLYVADYVLAGYGTGAIMAVPAHDERDFEFAKKFGLPVVQVVAKHFTLTGEDAARPGIETLTRDCVDLIIEHPTDGTFLLMKELDGERAVVHFVGGGTDGEPDEIAIARELEEETGFTNFEILSKCIATSTCLAYRHTKNKNQHTKSNFYHIKLTSLAQKPSEIDQGNHTIEWVPKESVFQAITWDGHRGGWSAFLNGAIYTGTGVLINSNEFDGISSEEAKEAITEKVGGKMTNTYRLRDWSIGRQRYWGVPIPIVYDPEGKAHPIPKEHLPWHLPTDVDFTPTGIAPLAKSKELKERVEQIFGKGWTPEVETMDTFVDSSWYFIRYGDNHNDTALASLENQKEWMPVDVYFGGSEHTTMHVLYSRFWQKALYDLGLVTTNEPYITRINRGLVLGPDGNKMSKSKGNVIDPDEQVTRLGADTVKMYLAFMGPYGEVTNYPWDMGGIVGLRRFLERAYGLQSHISESESPEVTKSLHKTIDKITKDIAVYKFNTAISALMIFINQVEKEGLTNSSYCTFLQLLAPFAPHLSEELWHEAGHAESIHTTSWPVADPSFIADADVTISVQINGKMRGVVTVSYDAVENDVIQAIKMTPELQGRVTEVPKRVVFVKNKIINLILE